MGGTQITPQPNIAGGLNQTTDIFKTNPAEWISATNFMVGRPGGSGNDIPGKFLSAMSIPPMRQIAAVTTDPYSYGVTVPSRFFVARLDPTEQWIFTGTARWNGTPLSQGNDCIQANTAQSTTATSTLTFSKSLNISSAYRVSGWALMLDTRATSAPYTSVTLTFLNSNPSNYSTWTITPTNGSHVLTLAFSSETGTFDSTAVTGLVISATTDGSNGHSFLMADLRFQNSSILGYITNCISFGQGATALAPDGTSLVNSTGISALVGCQDMVLIGLYPFSTWYKVQTGFPHVSILSSPTGTNFYFAQYPDPTNPAQNLAVLMDGASYPIQFSPCATRSTQFSRILAGLNEIQTITFSANPTSGNFKLNFNGQATSNIAYNASASTIQSDLAALSTIGTGNVLVTGSIATSLVVTFQGTLSYTPLSLLTISNNTLAVSSSTVSFSYSVAGGANLQQTIHPNQPSTSGTYTLTLKNGVTGTLQYNSNSSQIMTALQNTFIPGVSPIAVVSVSGDMTTGGPIVILFGAVMGAITQAYTIQVTNSSLAGSQAVVGTIVETELGAGGPIYKYCWTYKNMLFFAGNPDQPFSVAPSDVFGTQNTSGQQATFETGNILVFKSQTATKVTGGYDMDDYCIVTTDADVYLLFGSDPDSAVGDFDIKRSKSKVGCIEQAAGIRVGAGFYFYSGEDIYVFNGTDSETITSNKIQSKLDNIPIALRRAVYLGYGPERNVLLVHVPFQDSNSNLYFETLTYHLQSGAWGELNGIKNSQQSISISPASPLSSGTFSLVYTDSNSVTWTTSALSQSSSPQDFEAALVATGGIPLGSVAVSLFYSSSILSQIVVDFLGTLAGKAQTLLTISGNTTGKTITPSSAITGGITAQLQSACSLGMPSDGTNAKQVFFQFGDSILEWDPPATFATLINRPSSLTMSFNQMGSPNIDKDFMRYLLKAMGPSNATTQAINLTFYSDSDPTTVRQFISNLTPIKSTIDTLVNGVTGDSLSVSVSTIVPYGDTDAVFLSGYLTYWQSLEDL